MNQCLHPPSSCWIYNCSSRAYFKDRKTAYASRFCSPFHDHSAPVLRSSRGRKYIFSPLHASSMWVTTLCILSHHGQALERLQFDKQFVAPEQCFFLGTRREAAVNIRNKFLDRHLALLAKNICWITGANIERTTFPIQSALSRNDKAIIFSHGIQNWICQTYSCPD